MATTPEEISRLDNLHERGLKNEVPGLEVVGPEKIMEIEPHCRVCIITICNTLKSHIIQNLVLYLQFTSPQIIHFVMC